MSAVFSLLRFHTHNHNQLTLLSKEYWSHNLLEIKFYMNYYFIISLLMSLCKMVGIFIQQPTRFWWINWSLVFVGFCVWLIDSDIKQSIVYSSQKGQGRIYKLCMWITCLRLLNATFVRLYFSFWITSQQLWCVCCEGIQHVPNSK